MRALAIALCALAVSACAPQIAPPGPGPATPALTDTGFLTADGLVLPLRRWLPETEPSGVVLAVHGFNDYSKAYDKVPGTLGAGPVLAAHGFVVYAYDQRGFGAAPHFGLWPGKDVLAGDFRDFAKVLGDTYPGLPLYAIGVSMGGAVITTAMTAASPPPVDAVVLVAPAVWSRGTMPLAYRVSLWLGAHVLPRAKPSGRGLGRRASDNIEMLRDNARDPLFIKDTRIDSIYGLSNLMDEAQKNVGRLPVPALYLYGAKDEIIPKNATSAAVEKFLAEGGPRRLAFYPDGWHMMLRDLQAPAVLADIAGYLADQSAPLPSGAEDQALERLKTAGK